MVYGMCFDGSVVRGRGDDGQPLHFSNTRATGHVEHLEFHYARARQMGLTRFRDTVLWDEQNRAPDYHWLDRLQAVGQGQIELVLNHYGLPEWIDEAMFWDGRAAAMMHDLAQQIAQRYPGAFRSYNVGVELGIWTDWVAAPQSRQWPFGGRSWWEVYRQTSAITIAIAQGLKAGDPACRTAMSEPWGWDPAVPYADQARPFTTVLGRPDAVAEAHGCHTWQQGRADLLDVVGLNIYFDNDIPALLAAARQLFPGKAVIVAETANIYRPDCHPPALWWAKFEALGEPDLEVCWSPGLTVLTHELGERMAGNLLSEDGAQHWHRPGY
ncbi:hypothetical protein [Hymenobacter coccineus]|uniref:Beta-glucosidase n=1 Tax=Hymenobacter coccineus TaxID=1908235 RepID=A0A1G1SRA9_9BACT|nr:hypothetical protein [Hymenobacter coccineus]OGX81145.1 hypothetical protein BEN49_15855 [Hymenobacter coccineus]